MKRCPDNQCTAQQWDEYFILTHRIYCNAFTWSTGKSEDFSPSPLPEAYLDHCQVGPSKMCKKILSLPGISSLRPKVESNILKQNNKTYDIY